MKARTFELIVTAASAGERLDTLIAGCGADLTRSRVKALIAGGGVRVDGVPASKAGMPVREGQRIAVALPEPRKLDLTPQDVGIRILYEDDALAVLEKPAGISVHPSETERQATVVHGLLHSLRSLSSVGGTERPGIVHRIDKGTSGILVVSKTDQSHLRLSAQFKAHSIDRRYRALVYGDPRAKTGRTSDKIETLFSRSPSNRKKMTGKTTKGRRAVTHWRVEEPLGALTLVECRLETGRTHQIRVHLSELGFPVVGDPLYGDHARRARAVARENRALGDACLATGRQLLHACHLGFEHPTSGKKMAFESEIPEDFRRVLDLARGGGKARRA